MTRAAAGDCGAKNNVIEQNGNIVKRELGTQAGSTLHVMPCEIVCVAMPRTLMPSKMLKSTF